MKGSNGKDRVFVQHKVRVDPERTPPIKPRLQICPLLAGLNRMGCRGPHCQWWVPCDGDVEQGECAVVYLALGMLPTRCEDMAAALCNKRETTAAWHNLIGRVCIPTDELVGASPARSESDEVLPGLGIDPEPTDPAEPCAIERDDDPPARPQRPRSDVGGKILRTRRGMSRQEVEELWGEPQQIREEQGQPCFIYTLPEGGRVYVMFRGDFVIRVARW